MIVKLITVKLRPAVLSAVVIVWTSVLTADVHTWKPDHPDDDWTNPDNYVEGIAPEAGDKVELGDVMVTLSDADPDSFNLASSLKWICPTNDNVRIVFNAGDGVELGFAAPIYCSDSKTCGTIVKKGSGTVKFTDTSRQNSYRTDMVVEEGTLSVEEACTGATAWFAEVAVSNNAVFIPRVHGRTMMSRLYGDGAVTNRSTHAIMVTGGTYEDPCIMKARVQRCGYYSCGRVMIWRTDNEIDNFTVYSSSPQAEDGSGVTGFYSIGQKYNKSSIGGSNMSTAENGGTFLYLGDGNETGTDKNITAQCAKQGPTVFDAGAYGGLTFTGYWGFSGWDSVQGMGRLVLAGSNTHECVIAGSIKNGTIANKQGRAGFSFHITKKGSGIWRLSDVSDTVVRENYTGIAVEEGTLKYDSIAEAGVMCSLGMATNTQEAYCGDYDSSKTVPYAFRLGVTPLVYPASSLATFEYSGDKDAVCHTRPIVLGGDARLLNSSGAPFRFSGVASGASGVQSLVLGGDGVNNEIQNLTDGAAGGRLGVIKEGSGTWTLAMTNTFSGPVVVKGGTLRVRRDCRYTWFRLVVKDLMTRAAGKDDIFKLGRWGLFDSDGYRRNINFTANGNKPVGFTLNPGEAGLAVPEERAWWMQRPTGIAELTGTGGCWDNSCLFYMQNARTLDPNDESTWHMFDMRLTNGTPEIAYYDLAVVYGWVNGWAPTYNLRSWSLLGSTDGWKWDELHSVDDSVSEDPDQILTLPDNDNYWMGQKMSTSGNNELTKHDTSKLQPIRGRLENPPPMPLQNVQYVSVSDGAVLEAEGDITLSSFRVDAGASGGTVKGFRLARNCSVDITNLPSPAENFYIPLRFEGCSPADALWSLTVDGRVRSGYSVSATEKGLRFTVKGLTVVIR